MTVRNACVARGQTTSGATTIIYTVPANTVLLLKFGALLSLSTTAQSMTLGVQAPGVGGFALYVSPSLPQYQSATWSGWTALNAGDQIEITGGTGPVFYWMSGALLPYATP